MSRSFDFPNSFYALLHSLLHAKNIQYIPDGRDRKSNRQIPVLEKLCHSGMGSKTQSSKVYFPDFTSQVPQNCDISFPQ